MDFTNYGQPSSDWLEFVRGYPPIELPAVVPGSDPKKARATVESSREQLFSHTPISMIPLSETGIELQINGTRRARKVTNVLFILEAGLKIKTFTCPTPDGCDLPLRLYYPVSNNFLENPSATPMPRGPSLLPLYYYLHSVGFLFGSLSSDDYDCRRLCAAHSIVVLSVNYRHTDTDTYPTQHNDAFTALQFALDYALEWGVDAEKIIVAGESAGASLAAATVIRAHNEVYGLRALSRRR